MPRLSVPALLCSLALLASMDAIPAEGIRLEEPLFLGEWSPFGSRWEAESPVCVWSDDGERLLRVVAVGSSASGDFTMDAGAGTRLAYRVFWYPDGRSGEHEEMRAGVPSRRGVRARASPDCALYGPQALVRVSLSARDLESSIPGVYKGELTLMLVPL